MSTQGQVLTLNRLRIFLADDMLNRRNAPLITSPIISIKHGNRERLKHCLKSMKNLVFTPPECVCQYLACLVIKRQPQPSLILLGKDKTPHLIQFGLFDFLKRKHIKLNIVWSLPFTDICQVNITELFLCFFRVEITLSVVIFKTREISRIPLALTVISTIWSSIPGLQPLYRYSSWNIFRGHLLFLQQYLCFPLLLFSYSITFVLPQIGHFTSIVAISHTYFLLL